MVKSKCLVVDLLPYEHSTRTRKISRTLAETGRFDVRAATLDRVGRVGLKASRSGDYVEDSVIVSHVAALDPRQGRDLLSSLYNLAVVYPVGVARLVRISLRTPADAIFIGHMSLFFIGVLHSVRHRSRIVLNARERLGGIRTSGSLGTVFSRVEPTVLKFLQLFDTTIVAVADGHADEFRAAGMKNVIVVRNVPDKSFSPTYQPPPDGPLVVALVGSLYEGRGVVPLIRAVSQVHSEGVNIRLEITGRGNPAFLASMNNEIRSHGMTDVISYLGECAPGDVPARYQRAHISTALYEAVDAANDSLSNKLFEGPACGRPVLAGNLPENARVIDGYSLGWTSGVTTSALAAALRAIAADRGAVDKLGRHCFETVRDELNWELEAAPLVDSLTVAWPSKT